MFANSIFGLRVIEPIESVTKICSDIVFLRGKNTALILFRKQGWTEADPRKTPARPLKKLEHI